MEKHLFLLCRGEPQFSQTWLAAKQTGTFKVMAAGVIVICLCPGEAASLISRLREAGMPEDVACHDGMVPTEVVTAITDVYARKNVQRLSDMYGPTKEDAAPLLTKRSYRRALPLTSPLSRDPMPAVAPPVASAAEE